MKIIRPEYTPEPVPKKEDTFDKVEIKKDFLDDDLIDDNTKLLIDDNKVASIKNDEIKSTKKDENIKCSPLEYLMQETINENKIKVEFTLTKKQYELWIKKGGVKWLKDKLIK